MKRFKLFLSGEVAFVYDGQGNSSYGIDGMSLGHLFATLQGTPVWASLAFSKDPITPEAMATIATDYANGVADGEYRTYEHYFSELTSETRVEESGMIGGHNIHARISRYFGCGYVCLILQTEPIDLQDWIDAEDD